MAWSQGTYLPRFYGLHRWKPDYGSNVRFVVMNNVFATNLVRRLPSVLLAVLAASSRSWPPARCREPYVETRPPCVTWQTGPPLWAPCVAWQTGPPLWAPCVTWRSQSRKAARTDSLGRQPGEQDAQAGGPPMRGESAHGVTESPSKWSQGLVTAAVVVTDSSPYHRGARHGARGRVTEHAGVSRSTRSTLPLSWPPVLSGHVEGGSGSARKTGGRPYCRGEHSDGEPSRRGRRSTGRRLPD
jgi:hypothetical protein